MIDTGILLALSSMLFIIGMLGVLIRRNLIVVFMCIELMLNAVNLSLVAFSRLHADIGGQISVFFVMVVAASEAAVGLAIVIAMFRLNKSVETTDAAELNG